MKHFWIECQGCHDTWCAGFWAEHGILVAMDETGESCTDCGSQDLEIGEQYEGGGD